MEIQRQICLRGAVEKTTREESAAYFALRPRGSQLGAWASAQSTVIGSRSNLENQIDMAKERFGEIEIPLPENWGGFRLIPNEIQFWQGRPDRLHDRFRYRRADGCWQIERLSP
jgi:pyridoxamine 5'-phosphate oxidase